jgi:hypothetical protein
LIEAFEEEAKKEGEGKKEEGEGEGGGRKATTDLIIFAPLDVLKVALELLMPSERAYVSLTPTCSLSTFPSPPSLLPPFSLLSPFSFPPFSLPSSSLLPPHPARNDSVLASDSVSMLVRDPKNGIWEILSINEMRHLKLA